MRVCNDYLTGEKWCCSRRVWTQFSQQVNNRFSSISSQRGPIGATHASISNTSHHIQRQRGGFGYLFHSIHNRCCTGRASSSQCPFVRSDAIVTSVGDWGRGVLVEKPESRKEHRVRVYFISPCVREDLLGISDGAGWDLLVAVFCGGFAAWCSRGHVL